MSATGNLPYSHKNVKVVKITFKKPTGYLEFFLNTKKIKSLHFVSLNVFEQK